MGVFLILVACIRGYVRTRVSPFLIHTTCFSPSEHMLAYLTVGNLKNSVTCYQGAKLEMMPLCRPGMCIVQVSLFDICRKYGIILWSPHSLGAYPAKRGHVSRDRTWRTHKSPQREHVHVKRAQPADAPPVCLIVNSGHVVAVRVRTTHGFTSVETVCTLPPSCLLTPR